MIEQGLSAGSLLVLMLVGAAHGQTPSPSPTPAPRQCSVPFSKEIDANARVLAKPEPNFSRHDRERYRGTAITLRATFCGSGHVTDIVVTGSVSTTADAAAIEAAKLIQFTPAKKDGKNVSREMILKYFVKD